MGKFLDPIHLVKCIVRGPSEYGKSYFPTNLILNNSNKIEKNIHLFTISTSRFISEKSKCFSNYKSKNVFPSILIEEDSCLVFDQIVNAKDFEKSQREIETYESKEELKHPQEYDTKNPIVKIQDDKNERNKVIPEFKQCLNALDILTYLFS